MLEVQLTSQSFSSVFVSFHFVTIIAKFWSMSSSFRLKLFMFVSASFHYSLCRPKTAQAYMQATTYQRITVAAYNYNTNKAYVLHVLTVLQIVIRIYFKLLLLTEKYYHYILTFTR